MPETASGSVRLDHAHGQRSGGLQRPVWAQVKSALLRMIETENLTAHSRLPSEAALCRAFGVSRPVVRHAMAQLVYERAIYKIRGKGAFVAGAMEQREFFGTTAGFSGEIYDTHRAVQRRVLRQRIQASTAAVASMLDLVPAEDVIVVERVLSVDDVPQLFVTCHISARDVPGLETVALQNRSLYETLNEEYGIEFRRAERWLRASGADAPVARHLMVAQGQPLVEITSVEFASNACPVMFYTALYRTDTAPIHLSVRDRA
mgnify:CR=1 FL=1